MAAEICAEENARLQPEPEQHSIQSNQHPEQTSWRPASSADLLQGLSAPLDRAVDNRYGEQVLSDRIGLPEVLPVENLFTEEMPLVPWYWEPGTGAGDWGSWANRLEANGPRSSPTVGARELSIASQRAGDVSWAEDVARVLSDVTHLPATIAVIIAETASTVDPWATEVKAVQAVISILSSNGDDVRTPHPHGSSATSAALRRICLVANTDIVPTNLRKGASHVGGVPVQDYPGFE